MTTIHFKPFIALITLCSVMHQTNIIAATFQAPWSISTEHPAFFSNYSRERPQEQQPSAQNSTPDSEFCHLALKFYQNTLSVVVYSACPMEPSCSNYSIQAIQKHGPIPGMILTFDRLLHEGDETRHAPLVKTTHRGYRFQDTVENNDFWWKTEKR